MAAEERASIEAFSPTWDALVDDIIRSNPHYAFKVCSPSRASLQGGNLAVHVNTGNTFPIVTNATEPIPRDMRGSRAI